MASLFIGDVIVTLRPGPLRSNGGLSVSSVDNTVGCQQRHRAVLLGGVVLFHNPIEVWLFGAPLWVIVADHVSSVVLTLCRGLV
jgi:hypothetical protein